MLIANFAFCIETNLSIRVHPSLKQVQDKG